LICKASIHGVVPTVTPDRRLLTGHATNSDVPFGTHTRIAVNECLDQPIYQATLADGRSPRKRQAPITHLDAILVAYKQQEEEAGFVTQQMELLCDRGLYTLEDYWNMYKSKWRPLEIQTSGLWRQDFLHDCEGKKGGKDHLGGHRRWECSKSWSTTYRLMGFPRN
jgi:hypothetical protein